MGPETRRRDSNIKVLNSMVLKLSNTEYMPIVCGGVSEKRNPPLSASSPPKMPCEVSLPALSLHLQGEAKLVSGLVQFRPIQVR